MARPFLPSVVIRQHKEARFVPDLIFVNDSGFRYANDDRYVARPEIRGS
nr:hypothetical protein [uncultured Dongia sp.]